MRPEAELLRPDMAVVVVAAVGVAQDPITRCPRGLISIISPLRRHMLDQKRGASTGAMMTTGRSTVQKLVQPPVGEVDRCRSSMMI